MEARADEIGMMDESDLSIIRRRTRPRVLLLDESFNVAYAETHADPNLLPAKTAADGNLTRLPGEMENAVRRVADSAYEGEQIVIVPPNWILRVSRLSGSHGSFIAVFIEEHTRREDLRSASRRFSLTPREVQVLTLILNGFSAAEIAARLYIAETTVSDYFKHLLRKTKAKNRAEMVALVLGWSDARSA